VIHGGFINVCIYLKRGFKEGGASFFSVVVTGTEAWVHAEAQEVPSEHQETLFRWQGDQALPQVAQVLV